MAWPRLDVPRVGVVATRDGGVWCVIPPLGSASGVVTTGISA